MRAIATKNILTVNNDFENQGIERVTVSQKCNSVAYFNTVISPDEIRLFLIYVYINKQQQPLVLLFN